MSDRIRVRTELEEAIELFLRPGAVAVPAHLGKLVLQRGDVDLVPGRFEPGEEEADTGGQLLGRRPRPGGRPGKVSFTWIDDISSTDVGLRKRLPSGPVVRPISPEFAIG